MEEAERGEGDVVGRGGAAHSAECGEQSQTIPLSFKWDLRGGDRVLHA